MKVLDFGLAKALEPAGVMAANLSEVEGLAADSPLMRVTGERDERQTPSRQPRNA